MDEKKENLNIFKRKQCEIFNLDFPEDIPLILEISKEHESKLFYKTYFMKTIKNNELKGYIPTMDNKKFVVHIKKEENGQNTLYSKIFSYDLDSILEEKSFLEVKKINDNITVFFQGIQLGQKKINELSDKDMFIRRNKFTGIFFSNQEVQIVRYCNTHQHTEYSFLDGIVKNSKLAEKIEYGCAITDHGNMCGTFEFYREMVAQGKKPIIGCEVYVERVSNTNKIFDSVSAKENEFEYDLEYKQKHFFGDHLILLAKDNTGLKNLNYIVSMANESFYSHPHVPVHLLEMYSEGLIATSSCIGGSLGQAIMNKDEESARLFLNKMIDIFGKDDFYLEIQRHHNPQETDVMNKILAYAKEYALKIVCGIDAHYLNKEDAAVHEVWLCQQFKQVMSDKNHYRFPGDGYYVMHSDEVVELFKDIPEALDNSLEIQDKCNTVMGANGKYFLPEFPLSDVDKKTKDDDKNQTEYFLKKCREGFKKRYLGTPYFNDKVYLDRMKFEIDTILKMGFPTYFTIVQNFILYAEDTNVFEHWRDYFPAQTTEIYKELAENKTLSPWAKNRLLDLDLIKEAKEFQKLDKEVQNAAFHSFVVCVLKTDRIAVGPGRGSAAGSLVAYCLGIVKIDPIPYGLLFERFLNPDRISMPDIDVDIADEGRELIIEFMRVRYGINNVSRIVTFGTAAAKAIIRDVCRVSAEFPEEMVNEGYAKKIKGALVYNNEKAEEEGKKRSISLRVQLANRICKTIPNEPKMTLKKALKDSIEFEELYENDEKIKSIIDTAFKLEGLKKNISIHACGLLVTQGPVIDYMPKMLVKDEKASKEAKKVVKKWCTQFQAPECEDLGCLKIDFLGLRTLGVITNTLDIINKRLATNQYTDELTPTEIKRFMKKTYPTVVENVKKECTDKLANNFADKDSVEIITTYLNQHKTCNDIMDVLTLQILAGQVETPYVYVGKKVASITNLRENKDFLDSEYIPINDKHVYEFISTGVTDGIFQIESPYMKSLMKDLYQDIKRNNSFNGQIGFERLCDANALGRPGPMKEIPTYIHNMLNHEDIKYDVDTLKKYLDVTNGIITYQEQLMFICRELAGFTPGQADKVRKGCAKKITSILDEYGQYFIYGSTEKNIPGCMNNGISESVATGLWEKMKAFGEYAFNKSHSVCYSANSATTAWLSNYFETEYMSSVLNSYLGTANRIRGYLTVCRTREIEILPPDINLSNAGFTPDKRGIRFGLKGIRDVGKASLSIIAERENNGQYKSLLDFVKRMTERGGYSKKVYEALCYSGCFDNFEGTRKDKLNAESKFNEFSKKISVNSRCGQTTLSTYCHDADDFIKLDIEITNNEIPKQEKLSLENKFAGFYITEHPLDDYARYLRGKNVTPIGFLLEDEDDNVETKGIEESTLGESDSLRKKEFDNENIVVDECVKLKDKAFVTVAGIIKELEFKNRASDGAKFAKFKIEDQSGSIDAIIFSKKYNAYAKSIVEDKIAIFECQYQINDYGTQLMVNSIGEIINADMSMNIRSVYLLGSKDINHARLQYKDVQKLVSENPGNVRVFFRKNDNFHLDDITIDMDTLNALYDIMDGEQNVTVNHY